MSASISKGKTFGATETVTNTKLHQLVDAASISGIVNAEIAAGAAIAATKLNLAAIAQVVAMSSAIHKFAKGADVASASTIILGEDGNFFDITGTTTITSITIKQAGTVVFLQFDGILTLTDGSNLKLDSNFVTAAESTICLVSDGTNWWEISRTPMSISTLTTQGDVLYQAASTLARLAAGTAGQALTTGGAGANPAFAGLTTQGDVEYHNGTTRTRLAPGTSGQFLKTQGPSANPVWANPPQIATGTYTGNGADNRSITGIGFQPDIVFIWGHADDISSEIGADVDNGYSKFVGTAVNYKQNAIQDMEADGFQLGTETSVNRDTTVYTYLAIKK